jgi:hypothetical protein
MSKTLAKIVAHSNISSHVRDLLATCLGICVKEPKNEPIIWVENLAGVRITKIKPGVYSIIQLSQILNKHANKSNYILYIQNGTEKKAVSMNRVGKKYNINIPILENSILIMVLVNAVYMSNLYVRIDGDNCMYIRNGFMSGNPILSVLEGFNLNMIGAVLGHKAELIATKYLDNCINMYLCGTPNDLEIRQELDRYYSASKKRKPILCVGIGLIPSLSHIDIQLCVNNLTSPCTIKDIKSLDYLCKLRIKEYIKLISSTATSPTTSPIVFMH